MHTCCLLVAAWMTAAQPPAPAPYNGGAVVVQPAPTVTYYEASPDDWRVRLRSLFRLRPLASPYHCASCDHACPCTTCQTVAPPAVVPTPPPAAGQMPNLQIAKKYEDKVGHEEDYSWITGHLFYVHADGGKWILRYARLDEVDKYGGGVVLTPTLDMKNFREGDLVCVFGKIIDENRGRSLGGPTYKVDAMTMVERSDP
jgi:hypothetical protein